MTAATVAGPPADLRRETALPAIDIDAHVRRLGLGTSTAYRLWCHRHGLPSGLQKSASQAAAELAKRGHEPHAAAPHHTARQRQIIEQIASGDFDPVLHKMPETRAVIHAFERVGSNPADRRLLRRLMLHVDQYANVVSARQMGGRVLGAPSNSLAAGLATLVWHRDHWLREPEAWALVSTRRHGQFRHLTRHLLARYDVPEFMDEAWFESDEATARQRQRWWIHVGAGGNIRRADLPIQLTRRMAHVLPHGPERTILRNLRWAQVIGMGGSERLARAVVRTRLGRHFDNDEFWRTVVLFLSNNPMLEPTWAGPVVDYVYNMKYAPQRVLKEGGGVEEAPPLHPDFTMRRRSATKLLQQVENWHGFLARESYVELATWTGCGLRGWQTQTEVDQIGSVQWTIQELCSSWELAAEGRAMNHCVASYAAQCVDGVTSVWSIGAYVNGDSERQGVLTVAVDNQESMVTQARGRYNAQPQGGYRSAKMKRLGKGYGLLLDASANVLRLWQDRERLRRVN